MEIYGVNIGAAIVRVSARGLGTTTFDKGRNDVHITQDVGESCPVLGKVGFARRSGRNRFNLARTKTYYFRN